MATNPQPFLDAARRYGSDAKFDAWARKTYKVSGSALLAKVAKGESGFNMGAVSSAGAKGGTQFMPATRADYLKRYGVDAWADPDQAIHATKLYLEHDPRGVAGYNPGMPSYTDYILKQRVGNVGGSAPSSSSRAAPSSTTTTTSTTPGVDNSGTRRQLVADFLSQGGVKNSQATAAFATGYKAAQDVPGRTTTTRSKGRLDPETASVHGVQAITDRADKLSKDKRPYVWGGGHGGDSWGLDCSGAVSQALGVDVRVASEFEKFGKPGPGKNVTILASDKHVLMRVRDPQTGSWHYWGTSRSNPDGGPGWIPASALPASYLKNFTARHPDGQ